MKASAEAQQTEMTVVLRPEVVLPDWSVVTGETARQAIEASFAVANRKEKWADLDEPEDRVWRAVLDGSARTGEAPDMPQLSRATGLAAVSVSAVLRRLRARDLVVLDRDGAVAAAYPFAGWPTGHRVRFDGRAVDALCAVDALGIGAMVGRDVVIDAACHLCGTKIRITTRDWGAELDGISPPRAVVWSGLAYADGCAATSGCTVKVFFCSDDHLDRWRRIGKSAARGFRLSMPEALQIGKAIFGPMLRTGEAARQATGHPPS